MALPTAALDSQQALILTQQLVLGTAIAADQAASDASTVAAVLAARKALAVLVAGLVPILFEGHGFAPPTPAGRDYELIYEFAYAMAPAF